MQKDSQLHFKKTPSARSTDQGFSMVELLVAMVIFMIITGAVYGVMRVAQQGRGAINQHTQLNKSVRMGMNLLGRDTYNAGYGYPLKNTVVLPDNRISVLLGIPNDFDNTRDTIPPIISGNDRTLNTYNTTANVRTDQVTFLFKDTTFNPQGLPGKEVSQPLDIFQSTVSGTGIDEIVPVSGSNAVCNVNDIYLITGNTGSTLGVATALSGTNKIQFGNGDVLGINQPGSGNNIWTTTRGGASIMRVQMVTYYVTADGTLMRREYANRPPAIPVVGWIDEPLVYGVENFQIQYVMDNGTISDNPSAGPDGIPGNADDDQANLAAIRQVRFTINVRTLDRDPSGAPYRETMTSTFSTRNLGYEAN
jgi:prepilin-type N-terminal cleavage/methylation domain-containing protein